MRLDQQFEESLGWYQVFAGPASPAPVRAGDRPRGCATDRSHSPRRSNRLEVRLWARNSRCIGGTARCVRRLDCPTNLWIERPQASGYRSRATAGQVASQLASYRAQCARVSRRHATIAVTGGGDRTRIAAPRCTPPVSLASISQRADRSAWLIIVMHILSHHTIILFLSESLLRANIPPPRGIMLHFLNIDCNHLKQRLRRRAWHAGIRRAAVA
jgi:hypothetical protein